MILYMCGFILGISILSISLFIYPFTIETYYPFLWFRDWQNLLCKGLVSIQFRLYSPHTISVSFFFDNSLKTQKPVLVQRLH